MAGGASRRSWWGTRPSRASIRPATHRCPVGRAATLRADRPAEAEIRETLRAHLPDYMIPSAIHWHDSLPLTRNGKVDRARLAATEVREPLPGVVVDSGLEREIAELWTGVLKVSAQRSKRGR